MADLRIPKKTVDDYFVLKEFQDDFNALNEEIAENKSELNSEITNNVNELNSKIDTNKSLTDSEIVKLKEIANTWEAFKNNGGEIGGAIISKSYVKSNENFYSTGTNDVGLISDASGIKYSSTAKLLYPTEQDTIGLGSSYWRWKSLHAASVGIDDNSSNDESRIKTTKPKLALGANEKGIILDLKEEMSVRPWSAQKDTLTLGTYGVRFKDLYLSGSSVSANGYTKLPNGLIMQWGKGSATGEYSNNGTPFKSATINFPISFPSSTLMVQTCSTFTNYYSTVESVTTSKFVARMGLTGNIHTQATTTFYWIAIGY